MTWVFTRLAAAALGRIVTGKARPKLPAHDGTMASQDGVIDNPGPAYCVAAPIIGKILGWSVYNHAESRIVATRLSQARATILCDLLNLCSRQQAESLARSARSREVSHPRSLEG